MSTVIVYKFRKLCKIADFDKVVRLINGTGNEGRVAVLGYACRGIKRYKVA